MTAQQARIVNIVQWTVAVLLVLNLVAEFRWPEWDARNDGVIAALFSVAMLSSVYRVRLETGRWQASLLVLLAIILVLGLIQFLP